MLDLCIEEYGNIESVGLDFGEAEAIRRPGLAIAGAQETRTWDNCI